MRACLAARHVGAFLVGLVPLACGSGALPGSDASSSMGGSSSSGVVRSSSAQHARDAGSGSDAGSDGGAPVDATADGHDARTPDGSHADVEVSRDAGHESSPGDAHHADTEPEDAATLDAHAADAPPAHCPDGGTSGAPPDCPDGSLGGERDAVADAAVDTGPPALAFVGRMDVSSALGPQFEWSGSRVVARFSGTAITLEMTDYGNYYDVYVDGALQPTPVIGNNMQTEYPLASGLATGTHDVELVRRTEADVSETQVLGVSFPGGGVLLPPPPRPARRIEIVGDSISCGLGALGVGPTCTATNANEDWDVTYGAVAARALGADVITVAWSGKGVYLNYDDDMSPTLPELYPYAIPTETTTDALWDFARWAPDAVVIDLGTNDFWNGDPGMEFETAYLAFLQTIRGHYPDAYILCANGPLLPEPDFMTAAGYIEGAVATMNGAGDARVAYLSFGIQSGADGYGCDYHPNVMTHAMMAGTLEMALDQALGW